MRLLVMAALGISVIAEHRVIQEMGRVYQMGKFPYLPGFAGKAVDSKYECEQLCMSHDSCNFGTYVTKDADTTDGYNYQKTAKAGECWLSAITHETTTACGVPCIGFRKVLQQNIHKDENMDHGNEKTGDVCAKDLKTCWDKEELPRVTKKNCMKRDPKNLKPYEDKEEYCAANHCKFGKFVGSREIQWGCKKRPKCNCDPATHPSHFNKCHRDPWSGHIVVTHLPRKFHTAAFEEGAQHKCRTVNTEGDCACCTCMSKNTVPAGYVDLGSESHPVIRNMHDQQVDVIERYMDYQQCLNLCKGCKWGSFIARKDAPSTCLIAHSAVLKKKDGKMLTERCPDGEECHSFLAGDANGSTVDLMSSRAWVQESDVKTIKQATKHKYKRCVWHPKERECRASHRPLGLVGVQKTIPGAEKKWCLEARALGDTVDWRDTSKSKEWACHFGCNVADESRSACEKTEDHLTLAHGKKTCTKGQHYNYEDETCTSCSYGTFVWQGAHFLRACNKCPRDPANSCHARCADITREPDNTLADRSVIDRCIAQCHEQCPELSGTWRQIGADMDGENTDDFFGQNVAMSGDGRTVAATSMYHDDSRETGDDRAQPNAGHVRIFRRRPVPNSDNDEWEWIQVGDISGPGMYAAAGAWDGRGLSLDHEGKTVAVIFEDLNVVNIYRDVGDEEWQLISEIRVKETSWHMAPGPYSISLSPSGGQIAIGSFNYETMAGRVSIYAGNPYRYSEWDLVGKHIDGEESWAERGFAVSLTGDGDGSIVAVGDIGHDDYRGHVRVYKLSSRPRPHEYEPDWEKIGDISGKEPWAESGFSVSISAEGTRVAVGAKYAHEYHGTVSVYEFHGGTDPVTAWVPVGKDIRGKFFGDDFSHSVSMSANGRIVAIGAPIDIDSGRDVAIGAPHDSEGSEAPSHVRVYQEVRGEWELLDAQINGEGLGTQSGWSISLSHDGKHIAIGAPTNRGPSSDQRDNENRYKGHMRVYGLRFDQCKEDTHYAPDDLGLGPSWVNPANPCQNSGICRDGVNGATCTCAPGFAGDRCENLSGEWRKVGAELVAAEGDLSEFDFDEKFAFGENVAMSGDGLTVAATSLRQVAVEGRESFRQTHVRIFRRVPNSDNQGSHWNPVGHITAKGVDSQWMKGSGLSLSDDGKTVAVAVHVKEYGRSGVLYAPYVNVYRQEGEENSWRQVAEIKLENDERKTLHEYDSLQGAWDFFFGNSISLSASGRVLAIGAAHPISAYAHNAHKYAAGRVSVYQDMGGVREWVKLGADIEGEESLDGAGFSVSLSGDGSTVAMGAIGHDDNRGHVRLFRKSEYSGVWEQVGDIDGKEPWDESGWSVSISHDGKRVAIGAVRRLYEGPYHWAEMHSGGSVSVYREDMHSGGSSGTSWVQVGSDIIAQDNYDNFGSSVSLSRDGTVVAIGARWHDEGTGHVRVYQEVVGDWELIDADIDGEHPWSNTGNSVSLSDDGRVVAIGSPGHHGVGQMRVFELRPHK